jgi:aryl-alcohol dehydrogenase-like predicted oxidoreductase
LINYGSGWARAQRAGDRHLDPVAGVRPTLTTKTFNPVHEGADHGLAPTRIGRQLRSSLARLGVEHVELYLAHDYDPEVPLAETFGAIEALERLEAHVESLM